LNGNLAPTFHKLNIHAGKFCVYNLACGFNYSLSIIIIVVIIALTPKEIRDFFIPIINLANYLKIVHESKKLKNMQDPPVVTVSCLEYSYSHCKYFISLFNA